MNHVLILTHNCLALTKKCVESVRRQTISVKIHVYDNESTDGTQQWIEGQDDIIDQSSGVDLGVSAGWNFVLEILFEPQRIREGHKPQGWGAEHVLVINNDTILPPDFYYELLSYNVPFVSGTETQNMVDIGPLLVREKKPLTYGPDFSAFLIKREAWEKIGPFDERLVSWSSDCDYDIRGRKAGIPLWKSSTPFYHERSSTLRLAPPEERAELERQANADRAVFKSIYGVEPGQPGYEKLFE